MTSFSKSQRALLLLGLVALLVMTGCSSKRTEQPPQKPQVTIDSSSVTQDLPQMDSTPTVSPSPAPVLKTPSKRAVSPQNLPKTTPKPTTSPSPKAVLFGAPIPWESTPPEKLATPGPPSHLRRPQRRSPLFSLILTRFLSLPNVGSLELLLWSRVSMASESRRM